MASRVATIMMELGLQVGFESPIYHLFPNFLLHACGSYLAPGEGADCLDCHHYVTLTTERKGHPVKSAQGTCVSVKHRNAGVSAYSVRSTTRSSECQKMTMARGEAPSGGPNADTVTNWGYFGRQKNRDVDLGLVVICCAYK